MLTVWVCGKTSGGWVRCEYIQEQEVRIKLKIGPLIELTLWTRA